MTPLELEFETVSAPQTFVHIRSQDGILGHAQEIRDRVPVGTWISVQPELQPTVTEYLTTKCNFEFVGALKRNGGFDAVLQKVR